MIVDIDGQRFNLAELPADVRQAKQAVAQRVFRGDADWCRLVGGGEVLINWRAVTFARVIEPETSASGGRPARPVDGEGEVPGEEPEAEPDKVDVVGVDAERGEDEADGGDQGKHDRAMPTERPEMPPA